MILCYPLDARGPPRKPQSAEMVQHRVTGPIGPDPEDRPHVVTAAGIGRAVDRPGAVLAERGVGVLAVAGLATDRSR